MRACCEARHEEYDPFAEADAALALDSCNQGDEDEEIGSDEEDDFGNNLLEVKLQETRTRCVTLPDGDVHLCDSDCPFAEDDLCGHLVCPYTGRVVGLQCADRTDQSTGRSTWSSDPDMQSGTPFGGWGRKRDMVAASRSAWLGASELDDSEMPQMQAPKLPDVEKRAATKRGALCVDEDAPVDSAPKRQRATKRCVELGDVRRGLLEEAERTLLDLLGKQRISTKSLRAPVVDPRLLNKEVLFPAVLKKYLKETLASGRRPQMDDVHNISLAVDKVIAEERDRSLCSSLRVRQPEFREASARLAVSIWSGACRTPYLSDARRGADAFRPFCAGVFYAFKRGMTLPDGTVIVPRIDAFTNALPKQKAIATDPSSKSLHASSHKGLRAIHRCINSVDASAALTIFEEAVRVAKSVR